MYYITHFISLFPFSFSLFLSSKLGANMRQQQRYPPLFSSYYALCAILYRDSVSSILFSITDLIFSVFMFHTFRMFHANFQSLSNNLPHRITAYPSRSNRLSCSVVYSASSFHQLIFDTLHPSPFRAGIIAILLHANSLSLSFVPPLVARNTVLVPLSFLVPQIHRSSSDRLACTVFFFLSSFPPSIVYRSFYLSPYPSHFSPYTPPSQVPREQFCSPLLVSLSFLTRVTHDVFFFAALRPSSVYLCPSPVPRITVLLPPVESNNSFPFSPNRVPPRPIHGRPTRLSSFHVGWLSLLHPSLSLPWNQCTPEQRRERGLVGGLCRTPAAWPTHRNKFHPPTLPLTHFCRAIIRCELESRRVAYLAAGSPFLPLSLSLFLDRVREEGERKREKMRSFPPRLFFRFTASREKKKEGINKEKATFRTRAKIQRCGDE